MIDDNETVKGPWLTDGRFINLLLTILMGAFSFFLVTVYNQEQATNAALNAHIQVASDIFVHRDDLADINQRLIRIENKLDDKPDKFK